MLSYIKLQSILPGEKKNNDQVKVMTLRFLKFLMETSPYDDDLIIFLLFPLKAKFLHAFYSVIMLQGLQKGVSGLDLKKRNLC